MALSRRNGRSRATLLFLILTSVTVITLDFRGDGSGVIGSVRHFASDSLAPVRDGADAVLSPIGNAFSGITGYDDLQDQNAKLKAQVDDLKGRTTVNEAAATELRDLLALDHLTWVGNIPQVTARVVGSPVSNFEQTIELNRGTKDGVDVDMPVITGAGLVGRVVQASGRRSMVLLITDPASSVGVRINRSAEPGIAGGEGPDKLLSVGFVEVNADVRQGDLAVTSGLEGGSDLFPATIPVGRVVKARSVPGELQQQVTIRPLADVRHLRYVKVLQVKR
ncbi:MAG: rod shape-determining protein MreC [Actinomycetia bacterium]|nr:rod shape-determining protein MreC [Actinomycetes bacterium]